MRHQRDKSDGPELATGAELRLTPSSPLSRAELEQLCDLIRQALESKPPKLRLVRAEPTDDIADPVIASAFVQAEEELQAMEAEFAKRASAKKDVAAASPTGKKPSAANNEQQLRDNFQEVVRAAALDGVFFSAKVE